MVGFDYQFLNFSKIYESIILVQNFSMISLFVLIVLILLLVAFILYIFPIIEIYLEQAKINSVKAKNKKMLKRIALQKDIEDGIANELKLNP